MEIADFYKVRPTSASLVRRHSSIDSPYTKFKAQSALISIELRSTYTDVDRTRFTTSTMCSHFTGNTV